MDELERKLRELADRGGVRGARSVLAAARSERPLPAALPASRPRLMVATAVAASVVLVGGVAAAILDDSQGPDTTPVALAPETTTTTETTVAPSPSTTEAPEPAVTTPPSTIPGKVIAASRLRPFASCGSYLAHVRKKGLEVVTETGVPGIWATQSVLGTSRALAATGGPAYSPTNVQEPGIDEPDLVKTDGRRMFTIANQRVWATDTSRGAAHVSSLPFEGASDMLLDGDRLIVIGYRYTDLGRSHTEISVVDVKNLGAMRVLWRMEIDGSHVSSRFVNGRARIVLSSTPSLDLRYPDDGSPDATARALEHNRHQVETSPIERWLPTFTLFDGGGAPRKAGLAAGCSATYRPPGFGGFGTLTVLTLDPKNPLTSKAASVVADGHLVYGSSSRMYVATSLWGNVTGQNVEFVPRSLVHAFDITDPEVARYTVSGEVRGMVLNQFSMSEHNGFLRVATTDRLGLPDSESYVTVLEDKGKAMLPVGQVGGLGKSEQIYAARFIGDRGYVVTFRKTDPLYVLDLSDPKKPRVTGELKIPGFSSYLHPIDSRYLIGFGHHVEEGSQFFGQLQMSVFDVGDPARPERVQNRMLTAGRAYSDATTDHHAFLWWAPERLAAVPYVEAQGDRYVNDLVVMRVDPAGIDERGRISHFGRPAAENSYPSIQRSIVIGDRLLTISSAGVLVSDLKTLAERTWVPFQ